MILVSVPLIALLWRQRATLRMADEPESQLRGAAAGQPRGETTGSLPGAGQRDHDPDRRPAQHPDVASSYRVLRNTPATWRANCSIAGERLTRRTGTCSSLRLMTDRQTSSDVLVAPMVIEYPFTRTTGPVIGAFLTGLRERVLVGIKAQRRPGDRAAGRVRPDDRRGPHRAGRGRARGRGHDVGLGQSNPHPKHPLDHPFAWALIRLDGADTAMLHVVDAGSIDAMQHRHAGRARWARRARGPHQRHRVLGARGGAA